MTDSTQDFQANYIELAADIVAAYVSNNSLPPNALGELLSNVHAAVSGLAIGEKGAVAESKIEKATPAQIRKSITPDGLISFEDGKSYKTLRRHLTTHGLTPEAYRAKHGLPADYPMVSAGYSAQRSELARAIGLGKVRKAPPAAPEKPIAQETAPVPEKPKKAGRPRKAAAA
ncbi:MucR family transcriptional regulator [Methylobacterium sp. W2]|uniref:MucR family transcriptional regulator n=1 Tax=Methylobacterium sp. W2 TaxID=2598107 RepID=UPI001D0C7DB5|nr:MucR family transcriptional regulator [Methylobacterium sp. W2]MCC0806120.1 MucR family transcriptional regulator [Methylobacterium sp. W2]